MRMRPAFAFEELHVPVIVNHVTHHLQCLSAYKSRSLPLSPTYGRDAPENDWPGHCASVWKLHISRHQPVYKLLVQQPPRHSNLQAHPSSTNTTRQHPRDLPQTCLRASPPSSAPQRKPVAHPRRVQVVSARQHNKQREAEPPIPHKVRSGHRPARNHQQRRLHPDREHPALLPRVRSRL